jgi:non-specific serine/threonine protein kinase
VSRDELIEAVWKHPHVSDEALSRCISLLRHALGDDPAQPRFLETIPKRGYRLVAPVELAAANEPLSAPESWEATTSAVPPQTQRHLDRPIATGSVGVPDWSQTNLGLQATRIIGRETELRDIRSLLAAGRLVTLTGSAGVGKTRLALEIAAHATSDFADGVWLVDLAPLSDPARVPAAMAAVLGVETGPVTSPAPEVAHRIAGLELLVVLDNCEHVVDAVAVLAEAILGAAPEVRLLATSQVPIDVAGEQVYPVPPLSIPASDHTAADDVLRSASARLFVERAQYADPHFALTGEDARAVGAICRRLEGIPLAIEMAATRAPMLGVRALAQLLDERFGVLTGGRRTAPPRQQTLRATLDWSYGLLAEEERAVLNRLAVFAGGFTLDAASAVACDERLAPIEVVDVLARLVARSLVVVATTAEGRRYRLLETTRAYAQERLDESPQQARATFGRHLDHYLALAEDAAPHLRGAGQVQWLARIDPERENFVAAHATCDWDERGGTLGLRLSAALKGYWMHRGGVELGHRLAVAALARPGSEARTLERCRALGAAGQIAAFMGMHADVARYADEALAIAEEIGDEEQQAVVLLGMAERAFLSGNLAQARQHMNEGCRLARKHPHTIAFKSSLQSLAELERLDGNLDRAVALYEESLALARGSSALQDMAIALLNLSSVSIARGDSERPPRMLLEALDVVERIDSKPLGANVLLVAAALATHLRAWALAAKLFGAGDAQCERIAFRREPADEAFLAPFERQARDALGARAHADAQAAGRSLDYEAALAKVRRWLEGRADDSGDGNVVALRRG